MAKYIDAEAFKRRILSYGMVHEGDRIPIPFYKRYFAEACVAILRWVCEEVDDTPAADVVEVRHGRWKTIDKGHYFYDWECSVCGGSGRADYLFCPNCGARMDGEEE